jgi:prepilin-type N-terminal cleavage/methylation domain-containing protein
MILCQWGPMAEKTPTTTSQTGARAAHNMKRRIDRRGFTLIELICVMVMLSAVMGISAPLLSKFFRGRSLQEESRRFLALTRYARSESVSRATQMELWVDSASGSYGLKPQGGNGDDTSKGSSNSRITRDVEYHLAEGLKFNVDAKNLDNQGMARILFWPDGSIDKESLDELSISEGEDKMIEIARAEFGMGYVIKEEEGSD